ncbi:MerR family transcriptional regulator [bacterium]|nr:MerR family transcriptional regulator [bacterium]
MFTVSKLARKHNLSRTTLLYYDRIGLLNPSVRTEKNYRLYSEDDDIRLARICRFRKLGLTLTQIQDLLADEQSSQAAAMLEERFDSVTREIETLSLQQQAIANLLKRPDLLVKQVSRDYVDPHGLLSVIREAGFSDTEMHQWHVAFERLNPDAHQKFLELLGVDERQIRMVREMVRKQVNGPPVKLKSGT